MMKSYTIAEYTVIPRALSERIVTALGYASANLSNDGDNMGPEFTELFETLNSIHYGQPCPKVPHDRDFIYEKDWE